MIVVDASALLEFLLQTPLGIRVEARLFRDQEEFHSPHLADVEVTQGFRRLVRTGEVSPDRAADALADLADFDLHRHPISISSLTRGSCARTSRRTTPCTSPWPKRSMRRWSLATRRSARRQVTGPASK